MKLHPLTELLKKGVKFEFTTEHESIVRELLDKLASPEVLAFPDYEGAISGDRPFRLTADAAAVGLGAVVEQKQKDGSVRPLHFMSRTTFPNEKNWTPTELE